MLSRCYCDTSKYRTTHPVPPGNEDNADSARCQKPEFPSACTALFPFAATPVRAESLPDLLAHVFQSTLVPLPATDPHLRGSFQPGNLVRKVDRCSTYFWG